MDKETVEAANRAQHFLDMLEAKPIKLADEFYSIHVGTEWEAEMRLSDLRNPNRSPARGVDGERSECLKHPKMNFPLLREPSVDKMLGLCRITTIAAILASACGERVSDVYS